MGVATPGSNEAGEGAPSSYVVMYSRWSLPFLPRARGNCRAPNRLGYGHWTCTQITPKAAGHSEQRLISEYTGAFGGHSSHRLPPTPSSLEASVRHPFGRPTVSSTTRQPIQSRLGARCFFFFFFNFSFGSDSIPSGWKTSRQIEQLRNCVVSPAVRHMGAKGNKTGFTVCPDSQFTRISGGSLDSGRFCLSPAGPQNDTSSTAAAL